MKSIRGRPVQAGLKSGEAGSAARRLLFVEIYTSDRPRRFNDRTKFLAVGGFSGSCAMIGLT
jgi:hypothetical protein